MIAYNVNWLHNLNIVKEAKQWLKQHLITTDQFTAIKETYKSEFYHPNLVIRILLFIATLIALAGITGIFALMLESILEDAIAGICLFYGIISWIILEFAFINTNKHYKSGVTEALLYHSIGFLIGGIAGLADFNIHVTTITCLLVFSFAAFRYLDLISTVGAVGSLAFLVFIELYEIGGMAQQIIPIAFIIIFTPLYFVVKRIKNKASANLRLDVFMLIEVLSLLLIYAAGNYLVVRELSISLMGLDLTTGEDIPFALLFYILTVIIPAGYLYFGIKHKDIILIRVSLLVLTFSVFTFKNYFIFVDAEIELTLAGIILVITSLGLFRYLRKPINGYTRENIIHEKWAAANPEAFIISQTLGGNTIVESESLDAGAGGTSGGGGSSESW